jgi:D-alanyl-D-alanine endopeptidase (penicillin-binding protein 7)
MHKTVCAIFVSLLSLLFTVQAAHAAPSKQKSASSSKSGSKKATTKKAEAKKTTTKKTDAKKTKTKKAAATKTSSRNRKSADKQAKSTRARGQMVRKVVMVRGKRKVILVAQRSAPPVASAGDRAGLSHTRDPLDLKSNVALVVDQESAQVLLEKNAGVALPIASITKLMTAMIVLDAGQDMNEVIEITDADIDREKNTHSRLRIGSRLKRSDLMHIALMSSENRAASALGRSYPGGTPAFVAAMNAKARELGMNNTRYVDASGLSSRNVSNASDLAKLVIVASAQPLIRQYSTDTGYLVDTGGHVQQYANTNGLVKNPEWSIGVQKTGYISEAGRCLVMQAKIKGREVVMVFLDSKGRLSRLGDASRVRQWLSGEKSVAAGKSDKVIPES